MQRKLKAAVERIGDFVCLDLIIPLASESPHQEKSEFFLLALIDLSSLETQVFVDRVCFSINRSGRSASQSKRLWSVLASKSERR
jgi:hypothetical protein